MSHRWAPYLRVRSCPYKFTGVGHVCPRSTVSQPLLSGGTTTLVEASGGGSSSIPAPVGVCRFSMMPRTDDTWLRRSSRSSSLNSAHGMHKNVDRPTSCSQSFLAICSTLSNCNDSLDIERPRHQTMRFSNRDGARHHEAIGGSGGSGVTPFTQSSIAEGHPKVLGVALHILKLGRQARGLLPGQKTARRQRGQRSVPEHSIRGKT